MLKASGNTGLTMDALERAAVRDNARLQQWATRQAIAGNPAACAELDCLTKRDLYTLCNLAHITGRKRQVIRLHIINDCNAGVITSALKATRHECSERTVRRDIDVSVARLRLVAEGYPWLGLAEILRKLMMRSSWPQNIGDW